MSLSLGGRYERDELLGTATHAWIARSTLHASLPLALTASVALERAVSGANVGVGRATIAASRRLSGRAIEVDWGLGARLGDIWSTNSRQRTLSTALRATLLHRVSVSAALGAERAPFGPSEWLGFACFGLHLKIAAFSADVRRGGQGDGQAAPTAVSVLFDKQ